MKNNKIQKTFIIGDKWLYYKIYCGVKTADSVLLDIIKPLTKELLKNDLIDKWFFIRYSDPEPHLRIRFYITDLCKLGEILIKTKKKLQPYIESKQIWNIQLDTYQRELARYGTNTIEKSESFFYNDSEYVVSIIQNTKDEETRFLQLFKRVETIITLFNLKTEIQLSFLDKMQHNFKEEFNIDKNGKKELSAKYRKMENLFIDNSNRNILDNKKLKEIIEVFLKLEKENELTINLMDVLASFIHMTINRGFRSKQRLYEMTIYDFLYRKNKSILARYGKI